MMQASGVLWECPECGRLVNQVVCGSECPEVDCDGVKL